MSHNYPISNAQYEIALGYTKRGIYADRDWNFFDDPQYIVCVYEMRHNLERTLPEYKYRGYEKYV